MTYKIACPKCSSVFEVETSQLGGSVQCPQCDLSMKLVRRQMPKAPGQKPQEHQTQINPDKAIVCPRCSTAFERADKIKRSFLGFPKQKCAQCGETILQPLTSGYRTFYLVVAILMGFVCLVPLAIILVVGSVGLVTDDPDALAALTGIPILVPGLIPLAMIYALIKDRALRKRLPDQGSRVVMK